jgi:hypothetical protein
MKTACAVLLPFLCVLAGCESLTPTQDAVLRFDQAAHAAAEAEGTFLQAEQSIDIDDQVYRSAAAFAMGTAKNFDLTAPYTARQITPEQTATRLALANAIALYADKLQALATGSENAALDANTQDLAKKTVVLAQAGHLTLSTSNTNTAAIVASALEAIAKFALDQVRQREIKQAAAARQHDLEVVIDTLKQENESLAKNLANDLGGIEGSLRLIVAASADGATTGSQRAETFFAILRAQELLHTAIATAPAGTAAPSGGAPDYWARDYAKAANDALDAVAKGNATIAQSGTVGLYAAAQDVAKRAKDAAAYYKSLSGQK